MNELISLYQYMPYTLKNTIIELRYNLRKYVIWLLINLAVIFMIFFFLNITSSPPEEKSARLFQLSGYLLFFWMAGAMYFSSTVLSRRGFILNITNVPIYVLVNIQIINFFFTFLVSFIMLILIKMANGIQTDTSIIGIIYFSILTYILLIPICTLLALFEHYAKNMRRMIMIVLAVLFLIVPILWLPSVLPTTVLNIFSLNPFYFLVNGFEEAVVLGNAAFYNVPNHLLFILELGIIYIWTMYLYRNLKDEINITKALQEDTTE